MNVPWMKRPSAFLPVVMSLAAMALVFGYVALYGDTRYEAPRQADEGAAARIYQLLMVVQIPIVAFFAINWLPRATREALAVLGLQAGAWLASLATLNFFER